MRDDKLQEIIELLPYSIRYSGEIEELLDYAREQAERVQELEEDNENLQILSDINRKEHMRIHEQNKRYRKALVEIINARNHFYATEYVFGVEGIAREALEVENDK